MGMVKKETKVNPVPPVPEVPSVKKVVQAVERAGDDKGLKSSAVMPKSDWQNKDRSIAILSLIADVFKSPVVAQMTMGKDDNETLKVVSKAFEHALKLYEDNK